MSTIFVISSFLSSPPPPIFCQLLLISFPRGLSIFRETLWVLLATIIFCSLYPLFHWFCPYIYYFISPCFSGYVLLIIDSNNVDTHKDRKVHSCLLYFHSIGNYSYQTGVFFWVLFSAYAFSYNFLNYVRHDPFSVVYTYTHTSIKVEYHNLFIYFPLLVI